MSKRIKEYQLAPNEIVYTRRRECLVFAYRDGERKPVHHVTTYHSTKVNRDGKQMSLETRHRCCTQHISPLPVLHIFTTSLTITTTKGDVHLGGKFGPLWSPKLEVAFHPIDLLEEWSKCKILAFHFTFYLAIVTKMVEKIGLK